MNPADSNLHRRISKQVLSRRRSINVERNDTVRFSSNDLYVDEGQALQRRTVILLSNGCSIPTCTMCPFTNYNLFRTGEEPLAPAEQLAQEFVREPPRNIDLISIYNDGSFFADSELSFEQRLGIRDLVTKANIPHLMVESLPQFITTDRIGRFLEGFEGRLTIGIGLQSSNDFVRQVCVGTSFTLEQFENALLVASNFGVRVKIYVMIKPPFLSDAAAYFDVTETSRYLNEKGVKSVTLCPTRIADNTLAHALYSAGVYTPPHLYTVLACLRDSLPWVDSRVAIVNLQTNDFSSITATSLGGDAAHTIVEAIRTFNRTRDPADLALPRPLDDHFLRHVETLHLGPLPDLRTSVPSMLDALDRMSQ